MARAACLCAPSRMGSCCRPAYSILARALRQGQKTLSSMGERECQEQQHRSLYLVYPRVGSKRGLSSSAVAKPRALAALLKNPFMARETDTWGLQRESRLELVKSHFRQTNWWSSVLVLIPKLSSKLSYGVVTEENEVKREKRDKAGGKVLWGCIGKVGICIRLFIKPIYCLEIKKKKKKVA